MMEKAQNYYVGYWIKNDTDEPKLEMKNFDTEKEQMDFIEEIEENNALGNSDIEIMDIGKHDYCECDNNESTFVNNHGCCEYCYYNVN